MNSSSRNDFYLRLVMSAFGAHFITAYDVKERFFELIYNEQYRRGVTGSFLIAVVLTQYVYYTSQRLDFKYDWVFNTSWRLFWQIILGFMVPAIFAFLLATVFFSIYGWNILDTAYYKQDYPVILLMIASFNLLILAISFFRRFQLMSSEHDPESSNEKEVNFSDIRREVLMVETATKTIPLPVETICFLYILNGSVFARTFDMDSMSESYPLSQNLRSLEKLLDARVFFRINRQMIINFNAVLAYSPGSGKTITLKTDPPPYKNGIKVPAEHSRLLIVSEDRASAFRKWMTR